jgi:hypothetical protein
MPAYANPQGLNAEQWKGKIAEISEHLTSPASLCMIGAVTGMFAGQDGRVSVDLDVLCRASKFIEADLRQACEKSGVLFNPQDDLPDGVPYLQLVEEDIVQVGRFAKQEPLMTAKNLSITRPPVENIVASKLLRASAKDLDDIQFLCGAFPITKKGVLDVVKTFPDPVRRETARENAVYLEVFLPDKEALQSAREYGKRPAASFAR